MEEQDNLYQPLGNVGQVIVAANVGQLVQESHLDLLRYAMFANTDRFS